jgi:hypothetical protein
LALNLRCRRGRTASGWWSPELRALQVWEKALFALLVALVLVRLTGLGLEVIWRPLFPWDASMHWATKAKVWFEAAEILPFVDHEAWLASVNGVYTDNHPDYPITVPLLQVWVNTALGRWDDSLMNLPWVLFPVALGLAFFGQARLAGVGPLTAAAVTYFLLSLPLLNAQVGLAGYADILLGACYGAAVMAFYQWTQGRDPGQGALALLLAVSCLLIKNEGFFWAGTLAAGWLAVTLPPRVAAAGAVAGLVLAGLALWLVPGDLRVAGNTLDGLGGLHFRGEALLPIARSLWVFDSWHLLWHFLAALVPLGFLLLRPLGRSYLGIGVALGLAAILFLTLYLFTSHAGGAVGFTSVSRITLHLAPAFAFLLALLARDLAARQLPAAPGVTYDPASWRKT